MRTRTRSMGSLAPVHALGLRLVAAAAVAGIIVALTGPAASGAMPEPLVTVTVIGTIANVVVDDNDAAVGAPELGATEVETFVDVAGELFDLPDGTAVPPALTGADVVITLAAPPGATGTEALDLAADDVAAPGARVVEVQPLSTEMTAAPDLGPGIADAVVVAHTLTILPVYWTAPDTSVNALSALATQTVDYWREQSGGRLSIAPSTRAWTSIADPGSCSADGLSAIFNAAMAANPSVSAPTKTNHVLVYFPRYASCAFAGRATLLGGHIWVNGYTYVDVAAHELGHNLGLGHANTTNCTAGGARVPLSASCTTTDYGDYADVMGIAMSRTTGNVNTALSDYLGYANVMTIPIGSAAVTVDLAPLAQVSAVRAIKIQVPSGTVYVDYRPAAGRDVRMPSWAGVQAHLRTTDRWGIPTTYLLDLRPTGATAFAAPSLATGSTWVVPETGLLLTVSGVGATATIQVSPIVALDAYVTNVYGDLFDRGPDPQGLREWTAALRAGVPRIAVANAITSSDEYRRILIEGSYWTYLRRGPDPVGHDAWLGQMRIGATIQQMEAGFLASPEYFSGAGSSNAAWVAALYVHVLGRGASDAEVTSWAQALSLGGNRYQVAMGFLLSGEHLSTVVDGYYRSLLGRGIDPTGRSDWVAAIQAGARVEAVIGGIISSDEYFARP